MMMSLEQPANTIQWPSFIGEGVSLLPLSSGSNRQYFPLDRDAVRQSEEDSCSTDSVHNSLSHNSNQLNKSLIYLAPAENVQSCRRTGSFPLFKDRKFVTK